MEVKILLLSSLMATVNLATHTYKLHQIPVSLFSFFWIHHTHQEIVAIHF